MEFFYAERDISPHLHSFKKSLTAHSSVLVCISISPPPPKIKKRSIPMTPQKDGEDQWLVWRQHMTCVGHLTDSDEQMGEVVWVSMAKCCRLGLLPVSTSWSSPWFWWSSRKNLDQTAASSGTLLASIPSLYDPSVLAVSLSTSSVPVATFGKSIWFQNKCAHADLPRIYTKCEMKTDLVILVKLGM